MNTFGWTIKRKVTLGMETWNVYRHGSLVGTFLSEAAARTLIMRAMRAL